jgi:hypothetical protein
VAAPVKGERAWAAAAAHASGGGPAETLKDHARAPAPAGGVAPVSVELTLQRSSHDTADRAADADAAAGAVLAQLKEPKFRPPENKVAAAFFYVAEHRFTDRFILFCIFVNSCTLALDDPRKVHAATPSVGWFGFGHPVGEVCIEIEPRANRETSACDVYWARLSPMRQPTNLRVFFFFSYDMFFV